MATGRQRRGGEAEAIAAHWLIRQGWQVVARNVRIARDEIDLVAIDPGPPAELVLVEVRSARSSAFGAPEERVDRSKVAHLYRAAAAFARSPAARDPRIALNPGVARLPRRVDLVTVDVRSGAPVLRHLRAVEPP